MQIRDEVFDDRAAVFALTHAAFAGTDPVAEPAEVDLLRNLFTDPGYDPHYSLVAVDTPVVIGHVIATWGSIDDSKPVLGVGPVAVSPEYQRNGVGSMLMQTLHDRVQAQGLPGIVLLGDPKYYGRFGYEPAAKYGIVPSDPSWGDYFMVRVFDEATLPAGNFRYAAPFAC
ncbi:N-acetyltransferase [Glutamicibacter endophyticus]